jgi:hypothetical protein
VEPSPLNVTASGAVPDVTLAVATALGAALTVIVTVAVLYAPLESVTLRVTA